MIDREINKSKVIINAMAVAVIVIIIAVLTVYLTNRKQAVEVSSEENNVLSNAIEGNSQNNASGDKENNTWEIGQQNDSNTQGNSQNTQSNEQDNTTNNNQNNIDNNTTTNEQNSATNNENQNNITNNASSNTTSDTTTAKNQTNNKSTKGVIWLTFDDGPSSNITPKILDILKKENIKATFFVINYSNSNEHLLKREVAEGHTIGIHGYSHEYSKIYKSKETFMSNVYTLQDRIQKSTGVKTMYTRFPGGSSNTVSRKYCKGIMTDLTKELLAKGFKYYDWNISSGDAGGAKNAKDVYNNVTKNLSKKRGNMILMHDFGGNKKGLEALPDIIKYAKKNGYTFAPIDDNTPMYAQHVNN